VTGIDNGDDAVANTTSLLLIFQINTWITRRLPALSFRERERERAREADMYTESSRCTQVIYLSGVDAARQTMQEVFIRWRQTLSDAFKTCCSENAKRQIEMVVRNSPSIDQTTIRVLQCRHWTEHRIASPCCRDMGWNAKVRKYVRRPMFVCYHFMVNKFDLIRL